MYPPRVESLEEAEKVAFVGILTLAHAVVPTAPNDVARLKEHFVVVVVSGDHTESVKVACQTVGLPCDIVVAGHEWAEHPCLLRGTAYSRMTPQQRAELVKTAQKEGQKVLFLGSGTAEAPACHAADVGVAQPGNGVIEQAADIVLPESDYPLGALLHLLERAKRVKKH